MADQIIGALDKLEVDKISPKAAVVLWGHVKEDGNRRRLYLSLDFDEYIDLDKEDVIARVDLFSASQVLAGSLVWVNSSAPVARVHVETAQEEADFLKGAIARGFLSEFHVTSMLGVASLAQGVIDPGSGGGCGTGATYTHCERPSTPGKL